jgi:hypothetical protein
VSRFALILTLATVVLGALAWTIKHHSGLNLIHPHFYVLLLYFYFLTIGSYAFLSNAAQTHPESMPSFILGAVATRLFFSLGLMLAYLLLYSDDTLRFALTFVALYFVYTGFEIYGIVRNLRPFSKSPRANESSDNPSIQ